MLQSQCMNMGAVDWVRCTDPLPCRTLPLALSVSLDSLSRSAGLCAQSKKIVSNEFEETSRKHEWGKVRKTEEPHPEAIQCPHRHMRNRTHFASSASLPSLAMLVRVESSLAATHPACFAEPIETIEPQTLGSWDTDRMGTCQSVGNVGIPTATTSPSTSGRWAATHCFFKHALRSFKRVRQKKGSEIVRPFPHST